MNQLESLRTCTTVVADTGDLEAIRIHQPQDATTNPTLLLKAAGREEYHDLVASAVDYASRRCVGLDARRAMFLDKLAVTFGQQILEIIPGRVSTEVDARLSFDTAGTVAKARALIDLYREIDVPAERVLIKIAATWEGIRAAEQLEQEGIRCNLTLLFSFAQAVACAQAGVTLISPFVGRIYDWHREARGGQPIPIHEDPGVESVTRIFHYYKKFEFPTQVMGASFRTADQILRLAGCDLLTISPELLVELGQRDGPVERRLSEEVARRLDLERLDLDEKEFRWLHNADAMAVEKLADGIRRFYADGRKLEQRAIELVAVA